MHVAQECSAVLGNMHQAKACAFHHPHEIQLRDRPFAAMGVAMNMRSNKTVWWWAR